jgi:hypothetical protein
MHKTLGIIKPGKIGVTFSQHSAPDGPQRPQRQNIDNRRKADCVVEIAKPRGARLDKAERALRLQDAFDFGKDWGMVYKMVQRFVDKNDIKGIVLDWAAENIASDERCRRRYAGKKVGRDVNAVQVSVAFPAEQFKASARAAAQVQNPGIRADIPAPQDLDELGRIHNEPGQILVSSFPFFREHLLRARLSGGHIW